MGVSVEVNSATFNQDVVEASFQRPVLVDFFATWCGPCQLLKPMLEKLVPDYDLVLAKIDIDQNPDLANTCRVEGVPDVRIVSQGKMYPGFVGVLPEAQLRDFLNQLSAQAGVEKAIVEAQKQIAADPTQAKAVYEQLAAQYPHEGRIILPLARFLIQQGDLGAAETLLALADFRDRNFAAQAEALGTLIQLKSESETATGSEWDAPFAEAIQAMLMGQDEAALQSLLTILQTDRNYRKDGARKAMLTEFTLLGDDHPLTRQYRKQLTQSMY